MELRNSKGKEHLFKPWILGPGKGMESYCSQGIGSKPIRGSRIFRAKSEKQEK